MAELSPDTQAVLDAAEPCIAPSECPGLETAIAAALRALATRGEAVEIRMAPGMTEFDEVIRVSNICAIAAELDPANSTFQEHYSP
jgi:hypothetical protein